MAGALMSQREMRGGDAWPQWVSLNGLWEFELSAGASAPPCGRTLNQTILVPFPLESCLSGAFRWPLYRGGGHVVYAHTISVTQCVLGLLGPVLGPSDPFHSRGTKHLTKDFYSTRGLIDFRKPTQVIHKTPPNTLTNTPLYPKISSPPKRPRLQASWLRITR